MSSSAEFNLKAIQNGALNIGSTVLFICDIQEKFEPVIVHFAQIVENTSKMLNGCKQMKIPVIATEQYRKGLGPTVSKLDMDGCSVHAKTQFNMLTPDVKDLMKTICEEKVESVILTGVEAHICVEQTAIELVSNGIVVHVVADCCSSRSQEDRMLAFKRLQQIGCFVSTSESILFKLLKGKDNPMFRSVASLVKAVSHPTGLVSSL